LMTDATEGRLGNQVETLHLGQVPVRGKTQPIELFTVKSLVPEAVVHA